MIDEQLARHQAAPGERPALLEPADERRQRRRQDDVAVERRGRGRRAPARPAAGSAGCVSTPRDEPVGDRRRGAEHDDEQDRRLRQLEQQDGEREPGDRRHRLQPGDERAERGPQHSDCGRPGCPTTRRSRAPWRSPTTARRMVMPSAVQQRAVGERSPTGRSKRLARAGQDVLGLPAAHTDELPDAEAEGDRRRAWARSPPDRRAGAAPGGGRRSSRASSPASSASSGRSVVGLSRGHGGAPPRAAGR